MNPRARIQNAVVRIKIIGVGGGGNNVLLRLAQDKLPGVELIAVNTDAKQLKLLQAAHVPVIQIGERLTKGRGTGGNTALGEEAAQTEERRLQQAMQGADLVFITAGMGGGVGTGAAPVIARLAHDLDILTVGVITLPFSFEGPRKMRTAIGGVTKMREAMDGLILVRNDNLLKLRGNGRLALAEAFKTADDILRQAILCISEVILTTGVINVDFADVTTIFKQSANSDAILGIGEHERAVEAVKAAISSPLIERSLDGAMGIILNISGDAGLSLFDVNEATQYIYDHTHPEVNIILGTVIDPNLKGKIRATLVATDFIEDESAEGEPEPPAPRITRRQPQPLPPRRPAPTPPTRSQSEQEIRLANFLDEKKPTHPRPTPPTSHPALRPLTPPSSSPTKPAGMPKSPFGRR